MNHIGDRIRKYRTLKGFSEKDFSVVIGISQGSLSELENGKTKPKGTTLENIIRRTDINSQWLMTGEGEMIRDPEANTTADVTQSDDEARLVGLYRKLRASNEIAAEALMTYMETLAEDKETTTGRRKKVAEKSGSGKAT